MASTRFQLPMPNITKPPSSPPPIEYLDWDPTELAVCRKHGLTYTIRSSKYPHTIKSPTRLLLTLNETQTFSLHPTLLRTFAPTLTTHLTPHTSTLQISTAPPLNNPRAWSIFFTWLYSLDKIPLFDYTPVRSSTWRTKHFRDAILLATWLRAEKFEKYLLRIVMHELWFSTGFTPSDLGVVADGVNRLVAQTGVKKPGIHFFATAFFRWRDAGGKVGVRDGGDRAGELDPYRWRVEHWYSICGTDANWGCFHAMNTSGWGGIWGRRGEMVGRGEVGIEERYLGLEEEFNEDEGDCWSEGCSEAEEFSD